MHPDETRRVVHQQQLRQAVAKSITQHAPPTPADLRQKLEAMADDDARAATRFMWIARLRRGLPLALAAAILLAIGWLGGMMLTSRGGARAGGAGGADSGTIAAAPRPIPPTLVSKVPPTPGNC